MRGMSRDAVSQPRAGKVNKTRVGPYLTEDQADRLRACYVHGWLADHQGSFSDMLEAFLFDGVQAVERDKNGGQPWPPLGAGAIKSVSQMSRDAVNQQWDAYWARVNSERLLAARALLDLSGTVRADVAKWLCIQRYPMFDDDGEQVGEDEYVDLDWQAWSADFDANGRPFSSTEMQLVELVAALAADRPIKLARVLEYTGSWETELWRVLVDWGTGGNNRDLPGRATVVDQRG